MRGPAPRPCAQRPCARSSCPLTLAARAPARPQELPSFALPAGFAYATYPSAQTTSLANQILLCAFCAHYLNRTFIFPMLIRGGKPTPFSVFVMALCFCLVNGWVQARALTLHHTYPDAWLSDPRFVGGLALFASGMAINIHADLTLIGLRKPGESGYRVPRGGAFELVSGANFLGECLEWTGFAIACWCAPRRRVSLCAPQAAGGWRGALSRAACCSSSLARRSFPAAAFALSVWCNIGPRAIQHHRWYLAKFEDYPKHRRALIPFLI